MFANELSHRGKAEEVEPGHPEAGQNPRAKSKMNDG
jgi:hypothetical protein